MLSDAPLGAPARRCLLPTCQQGFAYLTSAEQQSTCPSVCAQVNQVIAEGKFTHSQLERLQHVRCAAGLPLTPQADGDGSASAVNRPRSARRLGIILAAVGGVVVLVALGLLAAHLRRPRAGTRVAWPVLLAVGLVLLAVGLYYALARPVQEPVGPVGP